MTHHAVLQGPGPEPDIPLEVDAYRVALPLIRGGEEAVASRVFRWMSARRLASENLKAELTSRKPLEGEPWALELICHRDGENEMVRVELHRVNGGKVAEARVVRRLKSDWMEELDCRPAVDSRTFQPLSLVTDLIRAFGAYRDRQVLVVARVCDEEDVPNLARYLVDRARTMPVFVISPVHGSLRPLVSPQAVARSVVGLAHVFTLPDDAAAERVSDLLGPALGCSGGTMRLYRPEPRGGFPLRKGFSVAWDGHALEYGWENMEADVLRLLVGWWGEVGP
jgi:hypothetical protein